MLTVDVPGAFLEVGDLSDVEPVLIHGIFNDRRAAF